MQGRGMSSVMAFGFVAAMMICGCDDGDDGGAANSFVCDIDAVTSNLSARTSGYYYLNTVLVPTINETSIAGATSMEAGQQDCQMVSIVIPGNPVGTNTYTNALSSGVVVTYRISDGTTYIADDSTGSYSVTVTVPAVEGGLYTGTFTATVEDTQAVLPDVTITAGTFSIAREEDW